MLSERDRVTRRQGYVDAVWRIAERDGVERASMRAIAAEAGTSVGMLQHYFPSKDELIEAAILQRGSSISARLEAAIARLGTDPDPAELLRAAMRHRLPLDPDLVVEAHVLERWLRGEARTPLKIQTLVESEQLMGTVIAEALEKARSGGQLPEALDIAVSTASLVALNDGLMHGLMLGRHDGPQAIRIIEAQVDLLFARP